ncbi:MAG: TonB-dependent receptor, partial [Gammaproteobacteria bacterium]
ADILRARFSREAMSGPITAVHAEVYQSWVNHLMDNYSLRTPPSPMMMMKAPSTSRTSGGNFKLDMPIAGTTWTVGVDMLNNDKDANRYNVSSGSNVLNSVLWPGVSIYQTGLFAQSGLIPLNKDNGFKIGLRYDYVSADASRANVKPAGMAWSPNQLYTAYYGTTAEKKDENNIGGLLRFEHAVSNGVLYAGYARSVRTADATERYIASNSMTPDGRWVGNPDLRPEKHNQFEAGAKLGRGKLAVNGSVFYDQVQDFILRDRFHSTDPTLGNATIYRNVGAQLYGTNLGAVWKPVRGWKAGFNMSYVAATNTDDNRPIAQIPPLGGDVSLEYRPGRWYAGGKMIWNATQTRVDDNPNTGSGLDVGQTPGWSIMNVYGGVAVTRHVMARAGIDNLFNRNYANHLNKASAFDVTQVQVNEPGRVAWVRLSAQF